MTQKELKAIYKTELAKAWSDKQMIDFCSRKTQFVLEHNGLLFGIEKPSIKTDFCFGYGMYGSSTETEEENAEKCVAIAKTRAEYFIEENLAPLNRMISNLTKVADNMRRNCSEGSHPAIMLVTGEHYSGQSEDCRLRYYSIVNTYDAPVLGEINWDVALVDKLIEGYKTVKMSFTKRLNTYLKKYGLTKINSWSYVVD